MNFINFKLGISILMLCTVFLSVASAPSTTPSSTPKCCSEWRLTGANLELPNCTEKCVQGLTLVGINCNTKIPKGGWSLFTSFVSGLETVTGSFTFIGVENCGFDFESLKTVKANLLVVDSIYARSNFMEKLTSIESTNDDCSILNITKNLDGESQLLISRISNAIEKGRSACLASRPTTKTSTTTTPTTTTTTALTCPTVASCTPCPQPLPPIGQTGPLPPNTAPQSLPPANNSNSASKITSASGADKNDEDCSATPWWAWIFAVLSALLGVENFLIIPVVMLLAATIWERKFEKVKNATRDFLARFVSKTPVDSSERFKKVNATFNKEAIEKAKNPVKKVERNPKDRYSDADCPSATRVKLVGLDNDYINANYVDVPGCDKRFIGTQAPLENTRFDFFYMCLQENCDQIIKVTDNFEMSKCQDGFEIKCVDYYPTAANETMTFKQTVKATLEKSDEESKKEDKPAKKEKVEDKELEISVKCVRTEVDEDMKDAKVRRSILKVTLDKAKSDKSDATESSSKFTRRVSYVTVSHWQNWPDKSVPEADSTLPRLLRDVMKSKGPVIVHCSAGWGRTGCVIMTGYIMSQFMEGQRVTDSYEILENIRRQRSKLVQKPVQFLFIHQVLAIFIKEEYGLGEELDDMHSAYTAKYMIFLHNEQMRELNDAKKMQEVKEENIYKRLNAKKADENQVKTAIGEAVPV